MHLSIEFFDGLGCKAVVMDAEVVEQRVGVSIYVPEQFGKEVFAEFHPRGHVVGSRALLEHEAHAVVVKILQIGLEHMEVGKGIPHIAKLHHIVPNI